MSNTTSGQQRQYIVICDVIFYRYFAGAQRYSGAVTVIDETNCTGAAFDPRPVDIPGARRSGTPSPRSHVT